jgi:UDP-GlcNAc:undecaprenyl-phosphate GlcNAc-1-phosphate transferase
VVNALNLIDGLDGLAGGVAFIALGTILIVAIGRADPVMMFITAVLAGAVLGFLFYNFNPASIFMGDTGSMFLGFLLATTAIGSNERSTSTVAMLVPILALGFPIADTLLAMTRRAVRGVPMFSGDREHIHHRLLDLGLSQRKAVLVLYAVSIVLGIGAIGIAYSSSSQTLFFLLALTGTAYLALRHLGYVRVEDAARVLEDRRKNRELRSAIRRVTDDLRAASSLDDVWGALDDAARALGASAIALELPGPRIANGGPFSAGFEDDQALFRVRYSLLVERPGDRNLELGWNDGRAGVDRDTEIAIELLCDHLSITLQRLDRAAVEPVPGMVVNLRR